MHDLREASICFFKEGAGLLEDHIHFLSGLTTIDLGFLSLDFLAVLHLAIVSHNVSVLLPAEETEALLEVDKRVSSSFGSITSMDIGPSSGEPLSLNMPRSFASDMIKVSTQSLSF